MEPTKVYSLRNVIATFGGIILSAGYSDGDAIEWEADEDSFDFKKGVDGSLTMFDTGNTLTTVKLHLMRGSQANFPLSSYLAQARNTPGGLLSPLLVKDLSSNSLLTIPLATIVRAPDGKYTKEPSEIVWIFKGGEESGARLDGSAIPAFAV